MMRRTNLMLALLLCGMLSLSSCKSLQWWPKFDEEKMTSTIVVGYIDYAYYLNDPPCLMPPPTDAEIEANRAKGVLMEVCIDPPPLGVKVRIEEALYGKLPRDVFIAVTTSHSGDQVLKTIYGKRLLMIVETDGRNFHVPRYRYEVLYRLTTSDWALPIVNENEIYPLPCEAREFVMKQSFAHPKPFEDLDPESEWGQERIALAKLAKVTKDGMYLEKGIALSSIRQVLATHEPDFETYSCE